MRGLSLCASVGAILPAKIARASVGRVACARGHGRGTGCVGAWRGRERERASENLCFGGQSFRARAENRESPPHANSRGSVFAAPPCHRRDFARLCAIHDAPAHFSLDHHPPLLFVVEFTNSVDVTLVWRNYLCDSPPPLRASPAVERTQRLIFSGVYKHHKTRDPASNGRARYNPRARGALEAFPI